MNRPSVFDKPKQITAMSEYNRMEMINMVQQYIDQVKGMESYTGNKCNSNELEKRLNVWIDGLDQKIPDEFQQIYNKAIKG